MENGPRPASPWIFWLCLVLAAALHGLLLFGRPGLQGGADLLPHLRLIELMSGDPGLRNVYAPGFHLLGGVLAPILGLAAYVKLFHFAAALGLIAAFRFFLRSADLPRDGGWLYALYPFLFSLTWCVPKVEAAGYALALLGLGCLARRQPLGTALLLTATFHLHTASAFFFGAAGGVFALARRDFRGIAALAAGTAGVFPLIALHVSHGCSVAEALLFSQNDYLRATSDWSSLAMLDQILLLASPVTLVLAGLGARRLWQEARPVAWMCLALVVLYANELWLAPLDTRTSLDLFRGLSTLAVPACIAAGYALRDRPTLVRPVLALTLLWAVVATFWIVPANCHVRSIAASELRDLRVDRCTFRWAGPNIRRGRRTPASD